MSTASMNLLTFDDMEIGQKRVLERTMTEDDVNAFGHLSGDLNPLHMDEAFASRTPFKRRVVHGLLIGSLVSTVHTQLTGPGFVYVGQELRFVGPVYIGDTVSVEVTIVGKKPAKRILLLDTVVSTKGGDKVLVGLSALKELRMR